MARLPGRDCWPGSRRSHKAARYSNGANWGASNNTRIIQRDWRHWPDALIGIPTGRENGFFVVDADTLAGGHKYDGIANLAALEHHYKPLPKTLMAMSPSGSVHRYFKYPKRLTVCNSTGTDTTGIAPGVDIKGEGGMVIAPPSVVGERRYRWLNWGTPIAEAPSWLLKLVCKQRRRRVKVVRNINIEHPDIDLIQYALDVIAENCSRRGDWQYRLWWEVCCALRRELGDDGLALFDNWSSKSPTYTGATFFAKWENCGHDRFNYRLATILHYANMADPSWRSAYEAEWAKNNGTHDAGEKLWIRTAAPTMQKWLRHFQKRR